MADDVRARRGIDLDDLPALEAHLEAVHPRAGRDQRRSRPDRPLRPAPVRAREDFLGRDVGHVRDALQGLLARALPAAAGDEPDGEIGSRPAVANRVEPARAELLGARTETSGVLLPRRDWVVLVEARGGRDRVPEAPDVGLPEDLLRPALVRRRDHGPVHVAPGYRLKRGLAELGRFGLAHERRVEIGEEIRSRIAGERDDRGVLLVPAAIPVEKVRRRPAELALGAELDRRAAQGQVAVEDDHVGRPGTIRLPDDRAGDLGVLDEARDDDVLSLLDVRADAYGECRVTREALVRRSH